jgi:hypothetical protein
MSCCATISITRASRWAHLASVHVQEAAKRHIGLALPTLRLGRDAWLAELRKDFDDPAHGVLGNARFSRLMRKAFDELVLPGF